MWQQHRKWSLACQSHALAVSQALSDWLSATAIPGDPRTPCEAALASHTPPGSLYHVCRGVPMDKHQWHIFEMHASAHKHSWGCTQWVPYFGTLLLPHQGRKPRRFATELNPYDYFEENLASYELYSGVL